MVKKPKRSSGNSVTKKQTSKKIKVIGFKTISSKKTAPKKKR